MAKIEIKEGAEMRQKFKMDGWIYIVEAHKAFGEYRIIVRRCKKTIGIVYSMDSKQDTVSLDEVEDTIERMLLEFKEEKEEKEDSMIKKKIDSAISSVVD